MKKDKGFFKSFFKSFSWFNPFYTKTDYLKDIDFEPDVNKALAKHWKQVGEYISDATEEFRKENEGNLKDFEETKKKVMKDFEDAKNEKE